MISRSDRAATAIGPDEAVGANAPNGPYHDDRGPCDDDRSRIDDNHAASVGLATTIGTAMPAGAASARGVCGAETREGAGDQNCCEKVFHVLSHSWAAARRGRNLGSEA